MRRKRENRQGFSAKFSCVSGLSSISGIIFSRVSAAVCQKLGRCLTVSMEATKLKFENHCGQDIARTCQDDITHESSTISQSTCSSVAQKSQHLLLHCSHFNEHGMNPAFLQPSGPCFFFSPAQTPALLSKQGVLLGL